MYLYYTDLEVACITWKKEFMLSWKKRGFKYRWALCTDLYASRVMLAIHWVLCGQDNVAVLFKIYNFTQFFFFTPRIAWGHESQRKHRTLVISSMDFVDACTEIRCFITETLIAKVESHIWEIKRIHKTTDFTVFCNIVVNCHSSVFE